MKKLNKYSARESARGHQAQKRSYKPHPNALDDFLIGDSGARSEHGGNSAGISWIPNLEVFTLLAILSNGKTREASPAMTLQQVWVSLMNASVFHSKLCTLSVDQLIQMYADTNGVPHNSGFGAVLRCAAFPQTTLRFEPKGNRQDQVCEFFNVMNPRRVREILREYCRAKRIEDEEAKGVYEALMSKAERRTGNVTYFEFPRNLLEDVAWTRSEGKRLRGLMSQRKLLPSPNAEKVVADEDE